MNKEQFIIELRKRLSILNPNEVDHIISEYADYIKQKQNEDVSEGLALEQLGNVNELAEKILKGYKINDTYIKLFIGKEKVLDEFTDFVRKFSEVSSSVFSKIEESVTDLTKTTGHIAKNVFKETKKYGEEKLKEVKKILKKEKESEESNKDVEEAKFETID